MSFFLLAFFQFFVCVVDFFDVFFLIFWSGREEERKFSIFFFFTFLFWVKGRGIFFFFDLFFHVFGFSDHFWPRPPLAPFFVKPFCAQTHPLTPKKLGQWGAALRDNLLLMSCSVGHGPPCEGPPCPRPPCAGSSVVLCGVSLLCCVVLCLCVGAVCVQIFRRCVQNLGVPPTPLRRKPQIFAFFFPSPATIFILSSSLGGRFR